MMKLFLINKAHTFKSGLSGMCLENQIIPLFWQRLSLQLGANVRD